MQSPKQEDKKARFTGRFWLMLIAGALLLTYLIPKIFGDEQANTIPYSEFKALLRDQKITRCTITSDEISGYFRTDSTAAPPAGFLRKFLARDEARPGETAFLTVPINDPDLIKDLEAAGVAYAGAASDGWWQDMLFMFAATLLFLVFIFFLMSALSRRFNPQRGLMSIGENKAKIYVEGNTKVTFKDVAGVDEAVEEVREVVEFLKQPDKFIALGGRIPKGVLLLGPPGTGKTLLARAVAGEAGVPFYQLSGSEFVEMFVGVGAARVRDLFKQAQRHKAAIIFIDELDAIGKSRGASPFNSHDEREHTLNQLLVEMDGFDANNRVIIMAATNRPEVLDLALLRPGRFDRQIVVDRPNIKGREAILRVHAGKVRLTPDVDLRVIASRTPGFVGADLANVINEAALLAARANKQQIEMRDLEEAIDRVIAGLEKKSRVLNKREKEIVAYHEAGHAVVAASLEGVDPVHRVTIIPRGVAALGHTLQLPTEDRYLMTRTELINRVKVLLGGRVAEEIIFQEISTGAQNDLERSTAIARSMVTEYGMSTRLGPLFYSNDKRGMFLGMEMGGVSHSEKIASQIDEEVRTIIDKAYREVERLLGRKRNKLEKLAKLLLEKEMVEGEELQQLLQSKNRPVLGLFSSGNHENGKTKA